MRSADFALRGLAFVLVLAGASGCSTLSDWMPGSKTPASAAPAAAPAASTTPSATAPSTAKSSPGGAATSGTPAAAPVQPEGPPPVNPAVQRAFDNARRALTAGRADEAERGFRALAQSNPELGGPHANLGLIYRQAGKLKESAAELEQAVRLNPGQPAYFNQLGITYRQQGQFTKARRAYESALALDASNAAATLNLGILCDLYLWDAQCALAQYDRYLALSPGGDATVNKWIADLKNRNKQQSMLSKKEKE